jgi:hypothetical protein
VFSDPITNELPLRAGRRDSQLLLRPQAVRKLDERFRVAAQSYGCCDFFSRCEATGLEN